jgi:hypothetical protein
MTTPEQQPLPGQPPGTLCWKVGPDGPLTGEGVRVPSEVRCAHGSGMPKVALPAR